MGCTYSWKLKSERQLIFLNPEKNNFLYGPYVSMLGERTHIALSGYGGIDNALKRGGGGGGGQ